MFFKLNQNRILFALIRVVEDQVVQQLDRHHAHVRIQRFHTQCYRGVQAVASLVQIVVEDQEE